MRDVMEMLLGGKRGKWRRLTPEEEAALSSRVRSGDADAVHELVLANLPLAASVAKSYVVKGRGRTFEDMLSDAVMGLYSAARKFDAARSKFSTYAVPWIMQTIRAHLGEAFTVRASRKVIDRLPTYSRLRESLGRTPTPEECGLTPGKIVCMEKGLIASLPQRRFGTLPVEIPDRGLMPDEAAEASEVEALTRKQARTIRKALGVLRQQHPRDADLLRRLYGVGRRAEPTKEIARIRGVTKQAVRLAHSKAMQRLQEIVGRMK